MFEPEPSPEGRSGSSSRISRVGSSCTGLGRPGSARSEDAVENRTGVLDAELIAKASLDLLATAPGYRHLRSKQPCPVRGDGGGSLCTRRRRRCRGGCVLGRRLLRRLRIGGLRLGGRL